MMPQCEQRVHGGQAAAQQQHWRLAVGRFEGAFDPRQIEEAPAACYLRGQTGPAGRRGIESRGFPIADGNGCRSNNFTIYSYGVQRERRYWRLENIRRLE